ncbi:MAG: hypothetical protein ACI9MC_000343 [Kiritimatiellia bacterium]|jgi:hypothetical protein
MLLLWMLLAADGGCSGDTTLGPVRALVVQMAEAVSVRDIEAFRPAWTQASDRVECLTVLVLPQDAAQLHASRYLHHAASNDAADMAFSLRAMLDVPGGQGKPDWLTLPEGAEIAMASPWHDVRIPLGLTLYVDGSAMTSRPLDRPAIYQAVDAQGVVLWTRYLTGSMNLPSGFTLADPSEAPPRADGESVLQEVKELLASGLYEDVVRLATPAATRYPELADSFNSAANLASYQLGRSTYQGSSFRVPPPPVNRIERTEPPPRGRWGAMRRDDPREGILFGVDVGFPTGLRTEWKIGAGTVDSVGLRAGGNLFVEGSSSVYGAVDTSVYMDTNLRASDFQLEFSLGVVTLLSGSSYGTLGAALQYDPPKPLQVNVGLKLTGYGYIIPDVSVGFMW